MKNCCQMQTKDGLVECGFLIGARCRADPKRPFVVDRHFHDHIKIVGCASWGKYLDYGRKLEDTAVSELPLADMGRSGRCEQAERDETVSMPVLQEGGNRKGDTELREPDGCGLNPCTICKNPSVVRDCNQHYCLPCAKKLGLI